MKKQILFLLALHLLIGKSYAQDSAKYNQARYYLNKIYDLNSSRKQFIKAEAKSFSESDMTKPSDVGEFVIARKNGCCYQQFKEMFVYMNLDLAIQIDTMDKTLVVTKNNFQLVGQLGPEVLRQVTKIEIVQDKDAKVTMKLDFHYASAYQRVEMSFDSSNFHLQKMFITFRVTPSIEEDEIRRLEINYLEISDDIPKELDVCGLESLCTVSKSNTVRIKDARYKNYELINLLIQ